MVGKTLGHYKILEPLGKGGMGEVYRAWDKKLDRDVAIKVLPEDFASNPQTTSLHWSAHSPFWGECAHDSARRQRMFQTRHQVNTRGAVGAVWM